MRTQVNYLSKILTLVLSLALVLTAVATVPFAASAEAATAPTKPNDATDYVDSITGFCTSCYGVGSGSLPAWNAQTKGVTLTNNGYGATLTQGYSVPSNKEGYLSVNALPGAVDTNYGIVFRSASFGNPGTWVNTNIFIVYVSNSAVTVRKYFLNGDASWGSSDDVIATAAYTRSAVATENVVIKSTEKAVSVWVDGVQYINEAAISATSYNPVLGFWFADVTISDASFWAQDIPAEPVPTAPAGNIDYGESITQLGASMWGVPAEEVNASNMCQWNAASNGFTQTYRFGNGAMLAQGYSIPNDKEVILKANVSTNSTAARIDVIFRAISNADYYALYIENGLIALYKYVYGTGDILIASNNGYSRTVNSADVVTIRSGNGKVSVWVNDIQYFSDVTIDTANYAPVFGYNNAACTNNETSVTVSGVSLVRTDSDLALNEVVPATPVCFVDAAESIDGFTSTMWGLPASSLPAWNTAAKGFTMTTYFGNGAFLTTGGTLVAADTVVTSADVTATSGRVDLIFRAYSNQNYYALYVLENTVQLYKYVYGSGDIFVASSVKSYSRSANDHFVIRSGNNMVSVWINGEQYFRDVAMDTDNYSPLFGMNQCNQTNNVDSITIANLQSYSVDESSDTHTAEAAVVENSTPTGYDSVVYCSVCGAEISRNHVDVVPGNLSVATQRKGNEARLVIKLTGEADAIEAYEDITVNYSLDGTEYSVSLDALYDSFINEDEVVSAASLSCTYIAILEIGDVQGVSTIVASASYTANGETVTGPTRTTNAERVYKSWK